MGWPFFPLLCSPSRSGRGERVEEGEERRREGREERKEVEREWGEERVIRRE